MKTTRTTSRRTTPALPRIKPKRQEDPAHLAAVRALPCVACQSVGTTQTTPTEAHHIRATAGMGQKAGDHEAIPLCVWHHRTGWNAFHAAPGMFQWLYGTERELLARVAMMLREAA